MGIETAIVSEMNANARSAGYKACQIGSGLEEFEKWLCYGYPAPATST